MTLCVCVCVCVCVCCVSCGCRIVSLKPGCVIKDYHNTEIREGIKISVMILDILSLSV